MPFFAGCNFVPGEIGAGFGRSGLSMAVDWQIQTNLPQLWM